MGTIPRLSASGFGRNNDMRRIIIMKKLISLVLALLMVLSVVSFSATAEDEEKAITIRWRYHSLMNNITEADGSYYDNRITQAHNEQSGIKVTWEYALQDGTEETQKQILMLTSGADLPDMLQVSYTNYQAWAPQGLFVETTDAIPTMADYTALIPQDAIDYATIDGSVYCFPSSQEEAEMKYGNGIIVRYDLFEQLGIEEPQTTDEYVAMWKLVQEKWPDMIPLAGSGLEAIKCAFGVRGTTRLTDAGDLQYHIVTDDYKAYVEFVHQLYAEGILNQEFGTSSTTTLEEQFTSGKAFSTDTGWATPATTLCHVYDYIEGSNLVYLPQITRDAETPAVLGEPVPVQLFAAIPVKKSDKFDISCEFINYMATPEAKRVQDYGIEGVDYQLDAEGNIQQTLEEQNAVGWKICYEILATAPSFYVRLYAKGFDRYFFSVIENREKSNVTVVPEYTQWMPTNEEYVELNQELGVLNYASEQTTLFIIGQRDMSEWDAFQAELKDRGIDELTEKLNEWYHMYY